MDSIENLRAIARPMVFDTESAAAPFSLLGTWFMAGYHDTVFALTARHVVRDCHPLRLVLYPTNASMDRLRVDQWWPIADEENDADRADVFVSSVAFKELPKRARQRSRLVHLDPESTTQWFNDRLTSLFFLCGYPSSINAADYDHARAHTQQILVSGSYTGPSFTEGLHKLRFDNPLQLDFNGLSGAPVFSLGHEFLGSPTPRFCGMALRGDGGSGVVHFLEASVLLQVLGSAAAQRQPARHRPPRVR